MGSFRWLSDSAIPDNCDLRSHGWHLTDREDDVADCILIASAQTMAERQPHLGSEGVWNNARRLMLISGVNASACRASLIRQGYGDVIAEDTPIEEVVARAGRLMEQARWVPSQRCIGDLELDLLARDAKMKGKALGLHPMEFAILWRLAEAPGEAVSKPALTRDVWRLGLRATSNTLAVQLSRLRSKLSGCDLHGVIETVAGSYRLQTGMLSEHGAGPIGHA